MVPQIFDRQRLRLIRNRTGSKFNQHNFLYKLSLENIASRIMDIRRNFNIALELGSRNNDLYNILRTKVVKYFTSNYSYDAVNQSKKNQHIILDEEWLPFHANSFDLIISNLNMHNINDLPGSLSQINNILKPNGVFVGSMFGGITLTELRKAMLISEIKLGIGNSPHIFPFANVQDMALLLQRVGFKDPVADSDVIQVSYHNAIKLMHDLRGMGENNILKNKHNRYLGKEYFNSLADMGEFITSFEIIYFFAVKSI